MAREFYGYFDSIDADVREYDAAQFAHILRASVQNGVSSHEGGLEVTADGLDMRTHVACGGCVIEGYVYVLEDDGGEPFALTHEPSGTADRIDRVVVRLEVVKRVLMTGVLAVTIPHSVMAIVWGMVAMAAIELVLNLVATTRLCTLSLWRFVRTLLPLSLIHI